MEDDADMTVVDQLPKLTVVLPIRNEALNIRQTIAQVLGQDYPNDKLEILVVVGDSDDDTTEIVQEIAAREEQVQYLYNPRQWSSSARNIGARRATGDIVTYIDGHTYIDNNQLLRNVAKLMDQHNVSVLSRPQFLDTPENTPFQQAVALARKSVFGHGTDSTIYSVEEMLVDPSSSGASYKREIFETVGYFDETFDAAEDYEFNYRVGQAGHRAFSSLKLAVYYYPRKTLGQLFWQMTRYGTGRARLAQKHPSTLGPGPMIPVAFAAGLVVLPLAAIFWSLAGWLFATLYGLYLVIDLLVSLVISLRHGLSHLPRLLAIFPTIHLGLGFGFIRELLGGKPKQKHPGLREDEEKRGGASDD